MFTKFQPKKEQVPQYRDMRLKALTNFVTKLFHEVWIVFAENRRRIENVPVMKQMIVVATIPKISIEIFQSMLGDKTSQSSIIY